MNRVQMMIDKQRDAIKARISSGQVTAARVEECRKELDMELVEYAKFQELKSLAVASNKLTLEEGQTIYALLGNSPETFNRQPVAEKYVLSGIFKELLQMIIRESQNSLV